MGDLKAWSRERTEREICEYLDEIALSQQFRETLAFGGRRVLLHHNVTPPSFFAPWDPEMVRICARGREEVERFRGRVDLALADSEFSRRELEAAGFQPTGVLPIYLDFARYREEPGRVMRRMLDDGRTNILFVGRLAPNKRQEDLVRLASYWERFVSPAVRLVLVGRFPRRSPGQGHPLRAHYHDPLQAFAYEEGLTPEEVFFAGHVAHDDLLACYATAHVFVSIQSETPPMVLGTQAFACFLSNTCLKTVLRGVCEPRFFIAWRVPFDNVQTATAGG